MGTFIPASPALKVVGPPSPHNASTSNDKSAYKALNYNKLCRPFFLSEGSMLFLKKKKGNQ